MSAHNILNTELFPKALLLLPLQAEQHASIAPRRQKDLT